MAFGITMLTMVYGGINTGTALAHAFLVGAALAVGALLASLYMGPSRVGAAVSRRLETR